MPQSRTDAPHTDTCMQHGHGRHQHHGRCQEHGKKAMAYLLHASCNAPDKACRDGRRGAGGTQAARRRHADGIRTARGKMRADAGGGRGAEGVSIFPRL